MNKSIFFVITAFICLSACTSAPKHLAKAIGKDKPYVAEQTRLLWPCITSGRDTVNTTDTVYDFIEPVPDTEYITKYKETGFVRVDTVYKQRTINNNRVIFEKVKDSTEVYLCLNNMEVQAGLHRNELAEKDVEIARQKLKIDNQDKKIERKNTLNKQLGIGLLLCLIWILGPVIVRIVKRFYKPI